MRQACGRIFDRVMRGLLLISGIHLASGPVLGQTSEWSLRRGVAIGSVDDPVYGLSEVRGVLADADYVYVLLGQEGKVRVFTRAGEFVRDLGSSVEFHISVDGITLLSVASPRDRPNVSIGQCVGITLHTTRAAVTDP